MQFLAKTSFVPHPHLYEDGGWKHDNIFCADLVFNVIQSKNTFFGNCPPPPSQGSGVPYMSSV